MLGDLGGVDGTYLIAFWIRQLGQLFACCCHGVAAALAWYCVQPGILAHDVILGLRAVWVGSVLIHTQHCWSGFIHLTTQRYPDHVGLDSDLFYGYACSMQRLF